MAREIPPAKRFQAVKFYFEGLTYDEIVAKLNVGKGSVAAIIEELRSGRFPKFEDVTDLVNGMRELAVQLRKIGIGPTEATLLFALTKRLLLLGVEPSLLDGWVRMCQSVHEDELPRSQIILAATKLAKLEGEGLSYEETVTKLTSASAELGELQEKLARLRAEEAKDEERRQELARANRNLEAENVKLQGRLDGIAVNAKEEENHCQELGSQVRQYQEAIKQLEARERGLTKTTKELETKAQALQKEVDDRAKVLKGLDEIGFSGNDLEKLQAGLREIAERHGKEEVAGRFFDHFVGYDSLLGLEAARGVLAKEVNTLTEQRDALVQLGERLMVTSDEVADGIAALKALRRKGISPPAIASYHRVLTAAGTDPLSFERLVAEFGGLEAALRAKRMEFEKQEQELETKRQAVEVLMGEEAKVKESIAALRESAVKEIKDTAGSAAAEVEKLCQGLHQDIRTWGEVRNEMGKCQEELRLARYFIVLPLSEEALSRLVQDIDVTIVMQYLTIALTWCRKKLNPKLRPPKAILGKYYSISEYTEVELADIVTWALLMLVEGMGSDQRRA